MLHLVYTDADYFAWFRALKPGDEVESILRDGVWQRFVVFNNVSEHNLIGLAHPDAPHIFIGNSLLGQVRPVTPAPLENLYDENHRDPWHDLVGSVGDVYELARTLGEQTREGPFDGTVMIPARVLLALCRHIAEHEWDGYSS